MKLRTQSQSGFTLIEMLVVIAIIALLASILVPAVSTALLSAKKTQSMSRARQFAQAGLMYSLDHKGKIPHVRHPGTQEGWYLRLWPYLDQQGLTVSEKFSRVEFRERFLRCPAYPVPLDKQEWNYFGFGMNGLPLAGDQDNWFYDHTQPTITIEEVSNPSGRPWFGSAMSNAITFDVQGTQFYEGGPFNPVDPSDPRSAPDDVRFKKTGVYSFFDGGARALTPKEALAALSQHDG